MRSNSCIYMEQSNEFAGEVLLGTDHCTTKQRFVCEVYEIIKINFKQFANFFKYKVRIGSPFGKSVARECRIVTRLAKSTIHI